MGLSVLTIQDEPDGSISLGITTEPIVESDTQPLTNAQVLGLTVFHDLRMLLEAEINPEEVGTGSEESGDSSSISE